MRNNVLEQMTFSPKDRESPLQRRPLHDRPTGDASRSSEADCCAIINAIGVRGKESPMKDMAYVKKQADKG